MVQGPVMETNSVRNPATCDDSTQIVIPVHLQSNTLLDGKKTDATLLISGGFLTFVGAIFTSTGWQHFRTKHIFDWTQLLGPILISVGVTFMLTGICKFGIKSGLLHKQRDEDVPEPERPSLSHSVTLSGINQTVMLQRASTMVYIPPVYNFINQDVCQAIGFQPGRPVNGVRAAISSYDSVYCVDNGDLRSAQEGDPAHSNGSDQTRNRIGKTEDGREGDEDSSSNRSSPPSYEDIYPSFSKHQPT